MLYNGSGQPKLLTFNKHFATIDFTTTTGISEGYKQKYQLKQRMGQFLTDNAVTGKGGAIVDLVDDKVGVVNKKVKKLYVNFWAIASFFIAVGVLFPVLTIPIAWTELTMLNDARLAIDEAQRQASENLEEAKREREAIVRLICEAELPTEKFELLCPPQPGSLP